MRNPWMKPTKEDEVKVEESVAQFLPIYAQSIHDPSSWFMYECTKKEL